MWHHHVNMVQIVLGIAGTLRILCHEETVCAHTPFPCRGMFDPPVSQLAYTHFAPGWKRLKACVCALKTVPGLTWSIRQDWTQMFSPPRWIQNQSHKWQGINNEAACIIQLINAIKCPSINSDNDRVGWPSAFVACFWCRLDTLGIVQMDQNKALNKREHPFSSVALFHSLSPGTFNL